jgi:hypothetical protein
MRRFVLAALLVVAFGSTARADGDFDLLGVLLGFSAKETCSCVFLADQTDEYCTAFGQTAGLNVTLAIDRAARAITSTFQGTSRTAHADAAGACQLDE